MCLLPLLQKWILKVFVCYEILFIQFSEKQGYCFNNSKFENNNKTITS